MAARPLVPRPLVLVALFGSALASACTAIVIGKIGDAKDYPIVDPSSSNPSSADPCSLLVNQNGTEADANACSDCIQNNCASDVAYACNKGGTAKGYFTSLQDCAQGPYNGEAPPGLSGFGYACTPFAKEVEVPNDPTSDTAHEAVAHNCVTDHCLNGGAQSCRLCEVSIAKGTNGQEVQLLRDDPCGSCLVQHCAAELSLCCPTSPIDDFVKKCAYTALPSNKATCLELGQPQPDGGPGTVSQYDDAGTQCLNMLSACFKTSCASQCQ